MVGVAGVLAFSVSARTREFGIRLAIGLAPRHLLTRVLGEGATIAGAGIVAGVIGGLILAKVVGSFITDVRIPGVLPIVAAAAVLAAAGVLALLLPAARASRVDVIQALRGGFIRFDLVDSAFRRKITRRATGLSAATGVRDRSRSTS